MATRAEKILEEAKRLSATSTPRQTWVDPELVQKQKREKEEIFSDIVRKRYKMLFAGLEIEGLLNEMGFNFRYECLDRTLPRRFQDEIVCLVEPLGRENRRPADTGPDWYAVYRAISIRIVLHGINYYADLDKLVSKYTPGDFESHLTKLGHSVLVSGKRTIRVEKDISIDQALAKVLAEPMILKEPHRNGEDFDLSSYQY